MISRHVAFTDPLPTYLNRVGELCSFSIPAIFLPLPFFSFTLKDQPSSAATIFYLLSPSLAFYFLQRVPTAKRDKSPDVIALLQSTAEAIRAHFQWDQLTSAPPWKWPDVSDILADFPQPHPPPAPISEHYPGGMLYLDDEQLVRLRKEQANPGPFLKPGELDIIIAQLAERRRGPRLSRRKIKK